MANYKNEEGHWITTKDGRHLFIREDLVDKQEREINEQKKLTADLTAAQRGDDKPEGKPLSSSWFTDNRKGISYGYHKHSNGYFVEEYDQKTEKSTIRRISKEEFEKGRGADHAKMKASDFTSSIADVRKMPEKSLRDIQKKNEAYIDLINQMKKSGYQGSEDKNYNDVISEFSALTIREGDIKRAKADKSSNTKEPNPTYAPKTAQDALNKVTAASKTKDKTQIKEAIGGFAKYLDKNRQVGEGSGFAIPEGGTNHIFNVTGNRVWYQNKAGTLFILSPNGMWLKLNSNGTFTNFNKISAVDKERVRALAAKMHNG